MNKIRILLIEDNRLLREGIAAMLNEQADMKVVSASDENEDILQKARATRPRVVLVDLGLQGQHSLRMVGSLAKEIPEIKVIGMGLIPSQSDIVEFVEAGASGFILKDATIDDFLTTIRSVAQGEKSSHPFTLFSCC